MPFHMAHHELHRHRKAGLRTMRNLIIETIKLYWGKIAKFKGKNEMKLSLTEHSKFFYLKKIVLSLVTRENFFRYYFCYAAKIAHMQHNEKS